MRLLDPFAGIYLASGIPMMHASLFAASFYTMFYNDVFEGAPDIKYAFHFLRWGHLLTWILLLMYEYTRDNGD